ncbi:hypothetical protein L873DRAFT_420767 [Choiromyces venosus 120613-1]|uniref:Transmembrane protein n=1 Tax=Choiromyces venosus 120613-1 TaxID=1336337 RepID=A0A3N4JW98_9PEZI|nr:hypothetical protein L873DRAFT_420767 [Choiromyces venosus 120613-1]
MHTRKDDDDDVCLDEGSCVTFLVRNGRKVRTKSLDFYEVSFFSFFLFLFWWSSLHLHLSFASFYIGTVLIILFIYLLLLFFFVV